MFNLISSLLYDRGIELFGKISIDDCRIIKPYLLSKSGIESGTAIVMLAPYLTAEKSATNVSSYAAARDYHIFFRELFRSVTDELKAAYPNNKFAGFADHSPIDEVDAAAKCGLGVIGRNGLLITEKHSSYVFIATLFTDATLGCVAKEPHFCKDCGACVKACPVGLDKSVCLSARTQKKGELSADDIALMKKHCTVWGCDICQRVCPYTKMAIDCGSIYTNIDFFNADRLPLVTYDTIKNMSEEEFCSRAYSWRGRDVILRNLRVTDEK